MGSTKTFVELVPSQDGETEVPVQNDDEEVHIQLVAYTMIKSERRRTGARRRPNLKRRQSPKMTKRQMKKVPMRQPPKIKQQTSAQ